MKILIVGAGIAGLTLARFARRLGAAIDIVETKPCSSTIGFTLILWPTSVKLLEAIGLADRVIAAGRQIDGTITRSCEGSVLKTVSYRQAGTRETPYVVIDRANLHDLLLADELENLVRYGTTVVSITPGPPLTAHFSDGRCSEYDLVVAADGIHSPIRSWVDEHSRVVESGYSFWLYRIDKHIYDASLVDVQLGRGAWSVLGPGRTESIVALVTRTPKGGETAQSFLAETFGNLTGTHRSAIKALPEDVEQLLHWPALSVKCHRWHRDGVVLIGDAAHGHPPALSSGANLAMEDARDLAALLGSHSIRNAQIDEFVRVRKRRARPIMLIARSILTAHSLMPPFSGIRDLLVKISIHPRVSQRESLRRKIHAQ